MHRHFVDAALLRGGQIHRTAPTREGVSVSARFALSLSGWFVLVAVGLVASDSGMAAAADGPVCSAPSGFACGDADRDGSVTSTDALLALQAGVGAIYCDRCLCNTSGGNGVTATDALIILSRAVGGEGGLNCEECSASVCADGTRTAFRGTPLGTTVTLADFCLLLWVDPNNVEQYVTVTITKALDTWIEPVPDVAVSIRNRGCDCGFLHADAGVDAAATTTTTAGGVTTTTLGFCNCMVTIQAESAVPLALVEAYIDLYDGDCGEFVGSGTVLVDCGVEEECDDGNQVSGDGCSAECRLEP
jgi:cysteine-rich repeat protein